MKVLLVGLAFAAAVVGGSIGYASLTTGTNPVEYLSKEGFRQAIGKEDTDFEGEGEQADSEVAPNVKPSAEPRIEAGPDDVVISEGDLNQMVTDAIASQPLTAPILDIAKEVNTKLEDDRIESGMTINLGDIPRDELPAEAKDAVDQLIETFPFLANRDVYLGIEGKPTVIDGAISLEDANLKLGPLTLPASSVASQLGVSQADIEQQLNAILDQQGLTPENIQVVDGQIIITGLP